MKNWLWGDGRYRNGIESRNSVDNKAACQLAGWLSMIISSTGKKIGKPSVTWRDLSKQGPGSVVVEDQAMGYV